jgi:hypothetical protein
MRRQRSLPADLLTIPIAFVVILYHRHQNRELQVSDPQGWHVEVAPVLGKAAVRRMCLRSPAIVSFDLFPLRVVIGGRRPTHVITEVKLPFATDRHGPHTDALDSQGWRRMGLISNGWLRCSNDGRGNKQQQREQNPQFIVRPRLMAQVPSILKSVNMRPSFSTSVIGNGSCHFFMFITTSEHRPPAGTRQPPRSRPHCRRDHESPPFSP